jgi:SAM-dependent methyltransferase
MPESAADEPHIEQQGHSAYATTIADGHYGRPVGGLSGKHDNVRTCWEDLLTRLVMRSAVRDRVQHTASRGRGVRILDLGCGAGQGYELITRIDEEGLSREDAPRYVLPASQVGLYLGLDLSDAMLEQGRINYRGTPGVVFAQADLGEGLGPAGTEEPFDVYFSSYGSLSHLDLPQFRRCLREVARQASPGAVIVLDLIGRLSLEWPRLWQARSDAEKYQPYSMSYVYEPADRERAAIESFPIRYWTGEELRAECDRVGAEAGVELEILELTDRSVMVGRHVDTREYGCTLPPLRGRVNRLFEPNVRSPLGSLRVSLEPLGATGEVAEFFATLVRSWNQIVDFTIERLRGTRVDLVALDGWRRFPAATQLALMTMDRLVDSMSWIDIGDVRANILEPHLGYVLARLEYALQRGLGCGHGLVAVLRVGSRRS